MTTAILVIDVQNGIFQNNPPFEGDAVVAKIRSITEYAKNLGNIVIYVHHEAPDVVEYGSENWQLYGLLNPEERDLRIRKNSPDSFFNTNLDNVLKSNQVDTVVICGYSSDFCIDRTAYKAACAGYKVTLITDAHTTHDKPHLSAAKIRDHHNFILSKHPFIQAIDYQTYIKV